MKNIKIWPVKKEIIGKGLGLFMLLVFATSMGCKEKEKDDSAVEVETADLIGVKENNGTVAAYVSFIASDTNKMTLDHTYTSEALLKLNLAVGAMADEVGFDIKGDLETAKEGAKNITDNPFDTSHADEIRKAADILSNVLQNIQVAKYPGLANETGELKSAAIAINPATLTLDQRDVVKTFFAKASYLLERMN